MRPHRVGPLVTLGIALVAMQAACGSSEEVEPDVDSGLVGAAPPPSPAVEPPPEPPPPREPGREPAGGEPMIPVAVTVVAPVAGAEVFMIPDYVVQTDPEVLCAPPDEYRIGVADDAGAASGMPLEQAYFVAVRAGGWIYTKRHRVSRTVDPDTLTVTRAELEPRCR